ncbi:MAG: response regulator [Actinomycetota bacterium]|jgi:two-component system chemotaxis response regulator CheY|nr:response regulator [Actinomycetota bacterium]MDA8278598.1 response regulator [Actinomycetota bacterium]
MALAMVIDDSSATRMILARILGELGYTVEKAENGADALHKLSKMSRPELILIDWNMPVMNGYEFLVKARSMPEYDDVTMMMVTTETEIEQVLKALEAGANEYVMKPFTKDIIDEKLSLLGLGAR